MSFFMQSYPTELDGLQEAVKTGSESMVKLFIDKTPSTSSTHLCDANYQIISG